mgnify:CR=1 FL=1
MKGEFFEKIRAELEEKEKVREELIIKSRELRISSSKAIANIHAGRMDESALHLGEAERALREILEYRKSHPDVFYLANDALQEFIEAVVFRHVVERLEIPESLPVNIPQAVLPGMADCIGEIRRYVLTEMIRGRDFERVERLLDLMEEIYRTLIQFDFHDRLTGNLRPKLDVARNVIERTKSDLIAARIYWKLRSEKDSG